MKTICITVNDPTYTRMGGLYGGHTAQPAPVQAHKHFAEMGVDAAFFYGIHADKIGVTTGLFYEVDGGPGCGFRIGPKPTGCWLSHRALWAACLLLEDDLFFIIEDDAKFPPDWKPRLDAAMRDAGDFDMLFVGSCCTRGKPCSHVAGNVFHVEWPLCTHGYLIRRRALSILIKTSDEVRCYAPIDISMAFHSFSKLGKVHTVLPRILDQHNTVIPE
jgi:GR25 family glycosyltransferase involved in LPS biosynthesis